MFKITFLKRSKDANALGPYSFFVLKWKLSALVSALDMSSAVSVGLQVLMCVSFCISCVPVTQGTLQTCFLMTFQELRQLGW